MPRFIKRQAPAKPTRKAIQAALNSQRPLDMDTVEYKRKKGVKREWNESVDDIGEDDA